MDNMTLLTVFQEEAVSDKLISFLNLEDSKALIATSKTTNQIVRNHPQFLNRTRLHIKQEIYGHPGLLNLPWMHLTINVNNIPPLDDIDCLLGSAESLYFCDKRRDGELYHLKSEQDPAISAKLEQILPKMTNVKVLKLEVGFMFKIQPAFWTNKKVQQVLSGLHSIDICPFGSSNIYYSCPWEGEDPFWKNFHRLINANPKLNSLFLRETEMVERHRVQPDCLQSILDKLKTVEHLQLQISDEQGILKGILLKWPALKSLTLAVKASEQGVESLVETLEQQLALEELDISLDGNFPPGVLQLFQRYNMGAKMKKLHLAPFWFREHPQLNWNFLKDMTLLKDFSVKHNAYRSPGRTSPNEFVVAENILECLPPHLEMLTLEGFGSYFWRDRVNLPKSDIGDLLCKFRNLKELDLCHMGGVVTYDGLQSIIRNCGKLQSLSLSYSDNIHHMPGIFKAPLNELRGLLHLRIVTWSNIHPEMLLPVVKFQFLRSFEFEANPENWNPRESLFQVVSQNPSLELLKLPNYFTREDPDKLNAFKEEVKRTHPRLQFLQLHVCQPRMMRCGTVTTHPQ